MTFTDLRFASTDMIIEEMNYKGATILRDCYRKAKAIEFGAVELRSKIPRMQIDEWNRKWSFAISRLGRRTAEDKYVQEMLAVAEAHRDEMENAFNAEYLDSHSLLDGYCDEIRGNMDRYLQQSAHFIAPYTSITQSSMMGKSRMIKEIAFKIPTVYICMRPQNDGYPDWSPEVVRKFIIAGTGYKTIQGNYLNELAGSVYIYSFFNELFAKLIEFFEHRHGTWNQKLRDLWYTLGEAPSSNYEHCLTQPAVADQSIYTAEAFWTSVIHRAEVNAFSSDERSFLSKKDELKTRITGLWEKLEPHLRSGEIERGKEVQPLLLIVWDEARILVERGQNGEVAKDGQLTVFRLMRRVIQDIGNAFTEKANRIRMFTLVTDTSSRLINFQPTVDTESDSGRRILDVAEGQAHFDPIYILPTGDYHARRRLSLQLENVDDPSRLIAFGRPAWYSTMQAETSPERSPSERIATVKRLASVKLFRRPVTDDLFKDTTRGVTLKMLACIGPRLQLQTGSYVSAAGELVASHLMVLFKVSADRKQLETLYPSEPILAEVSAEATAKYGWAKPLETLLPAIRHGIVSKGYRGEFITRILLLMAAEDAARLNSSAAEAHRSEKWPYAQQMTVEDFLNSYLRNPPDPPSVSSNVTPTETKRNRKSKKSKMSTKSPAPERTKWKLEDWDSEEETDYFIKGKDGIPRAQKQHTPWTVETIMSAFHGRPDYKHSSKTKTQQRAIDRFLKGRLFFNHFISMQATIAPSTLIKAFNRGAALMTKSNTEGVDFIIPVILPSADKNILSKLGPLFGEWSEEEQSAANSVVSYILIDAKNRINHSRNSAYGDLQKVVPDATNIQLHKPKNYFLSILQSYGSDTDTLRDRDGAMIHPQHQDAENFHDRQIPISALGLTHHTYHCLENRPDTEKLLQGLRRQDLNPLRGLKDKNKIKGLRDWLDVHSDPNRKWEKLSEI